MKIFNVFRQKTKTKPEKMKAGQEHIEDADAKDEEYQLPQLSIGDFSFTAELRRRQENEMLIKRYGIVLKKDGEFV